MSKPICEDCKHCCGKWSSSMYGFYVLFDGDARCALTDIVTKSGRAGSKCTEARSFGKECGPSGSLFEARPPAPPIIKVEQPDRPWWRFW